MRIVIGLLAVSAVACGDDGNNPPVGGGGFDGGFTLPDGRAIDASGGDSNSGPDGSVAAIDANEFVGRVCLLTDVRILNQCDNANAGGLTVRLGTATAVTAADGSFKIVGQSGSGLVWRITGSNIVSSFEPLADYFIPAIKQTDFDAMKSALSIVEVPGEGSMMVFVSRNGAGVAGQLAGVAPQAFYEPYYDGSTPTAWTQSGTGTHGAVWIPGLDVGTAAVTVDNVTINGPVFDGGITFANLILPPP